MADDQIDPTEGYTSEGGDYGTGYTSEGGDYAPEEPFSGTQILEGGRPPLPANFGTPTARDYTPTAADREQDPAFWAGVDRRNAVRQQRMQQQQQMASMMAMPLSHAERLHLMQLQQGLSAVQQQVFDGTLTPQEGQQLQAMLQTGINPYQLRQQQAHLQHMQLQNQLLDSQAAHQVLKLQQAQKFQAMTAEERIVRLPDMPGAYYWDHNGDLKPVPGSTREPISAQTVQGVRNRMASEVDHDLTAWRTDQAKPEASRSGFEPQWIRDHPLTMPLHVIREREIERRTQRELQRMGGGSRANPQQEQGGGNYRSPDRETADALQHIDNLAGLRTPPPAAAPPAQPSLVRQNLGHFITPF